MTMREVLEEACRRERTKFSSAPVVRPTQTDKDIVGAVLDALREPTEAMIASRTQAHQDAFPDGHTLTTGQVRAFLYANIVAEWQAMIDAAKAEREG